MKLKKHSYAICTQIYFKIELLYADEIAWASSNIHPIATVERKAPEVLQEQNLTFNVSKTEKITLVETEATPVGRNANT